MMSEMFPDGGGTPEGFEPRPEEELEVPPELAALFAQMMGMAPPSAEVTEKLIRDTARIHGLWFRAWQSEGRFNEIQAFHLTLLLVKRALRG